MSLAVGNLILLAISHSYAVIVQNPPVVVMKPGHGNKLSPKDQATKQTLESFLETVHDYADLVKLEQNATKELEKIEEVGSLGAQTDESAPDNNLRRKTPAKEVPVAADANKVLDHTLRFCRTGDLRSATLTLIKEYPFASYSISPPKAGCMNDNQVRQLLTACLFNNGYMQSVNGQMSTCMVPNGEWCTWAYNCASGGHCKFSAGRQDLLLQTLNYVGNKSLALMGRKTDVYPQKLAPTTCMSCVAHHRAEEAINALAPTHPTGGDQFFPDEEGCTEACKVPSSYTPAHDCWTCSQFTPTKRFPEYKAACPSICAVAASLASETSALGMGLIANVKDREEPKMLETISFLSAASLWQQY